MKWLGQLFGTKTQTTDALPATTAVRVITRVYSPDDWNIEFDIPTDWEILFEERPEPPNYGVFGMIGQRTGGPRPSVLLLDLVAVGEQVFDANGADDFQEVRVRDELRAVLRDDERGGIPLASAGGDRFHPVHHVAAITACT